MPRKKKQPQKRTFKQERPPTYYTQPAAKGTTTVQLYRLWPTGARELMCQHPGSMELCMETAERNRAGKSRGELEQEKLDALYGWDKDSVLPAGNFSSMIDAMLDKRKAQGGDGDGMVFKFGEKFVA